MRITLINQFYVPDISPTAHLSASLAEFLAAAGHEVSVITSRGGYLGKLDAGQERGANPRVFRVWTPQLGKRSIFRRCIDYGSFYALSAWRVLRLPGQEVIISLTTPPYIAWTAVLHRLLHPKARLVLWNMDCYPDAAERAGVLKQGGLASRVMRGLNRRLFARLDHLICLDEAMRDLLLSQYGPTRRQLPSSIIPNWEKASFFPPPASLKKNQQWSTAAQLPLAGKFVVLYLGNLGVGHPFETVIEASKRLRGRDVMFLFVGGGKRWSSLEEAVRREKLENVLLQPYVPKELTGLVMQAADCALITLSSEMLGVMSPSKLHANLAMGLPVIYVGPAASNVDAAIGRFGCGVSLRPDDAGGLVAYIERAAANREEFESQKRAARAAFDAAYCDLQTLPQFAAVIDGLFAAPAATAGAAPAPPATAALLSPPTPQNSARGNPLHSEV